MQQPSGRLEPNCQHLESWKSVQRADDDVAATVAQAAGQWLVGYVVGG
ncbi:hypothetical protein [Glutamicibacter uratoxydans]|nr:hypothetical protein [Glutamicibacter uratoxydans]